MSAIFDGSSAYLLATFGGVAASYETLLACWFKPANATARQTCLALGDNNAGGSWDGFSAQARGDVGGDPLYAISYAAGVIAGASATGFVANAWQLGLFSFRANNGRCSQVGSGGWGTLQGGTLNPESQTHWCVGAFFNATGSYFFNGRLAEVAIWRGISAADRDSIVTALQAGSRPVAISAGAAGLWAYQSLREAENESGCVGPVMTNTGVTFDAADHPIAYATGAAAKHFHRQMMAQT